MYTDENKITSNISIDLWKELYLRKRQTWLPVLSDSMGPLLRTGDHVLIQSIMPDNIKPGDIIVFKNSDKLIVHRIIRKFNNNGLLFLQKGDNTTNAGIVKSEDILGRVVAVRKRNKTICLNDSTWQMVNRILTCFSFTAYYLRPRNPFLRRIAGFFFNEAKVLLNHKITKI